MTDDIDITADTDQLVAEAAERAVREAASILLIAGKEASPLAERYHPERAAVERARAALEHAEQQLEAHERGTAEVVRLQQAAQAELTAATKAARGQLTDDLADARHRSRRAAMKSERHGRRLTSLQGALDSARTALVRAEQALVQRVSELVAAERERRRKRIARAAELQPETVLALANGTDAEQVVLAAQQAALGAPEPEAYGQPLPPQERPSTTLSEALAGAGDDDEQQESLADALGLSDQHPAA